MHTLSRVNETLWGCSLLFSDPPWMAQGMLGEASMDPEGHRSELWVNRKKVYRTCVHYVLQSKVSPEHTMVASWEHVLVWCKFLGQSARCTSFPTQWNASCQISSCLSPKWVPLKVSTAWPHSNSLHITEAVLKSMCEKQTAAHVSSCFTFRCPEQEVSPPVRRRSEKPGKNPKTKKSSIKSWLYWPIFLTPVP